MSKNATISVAIATLVIVFLATPARTQNSAPANGPDPMAFLAHVRNAKLLAANDLAARNLVDCSMPPENAAAAVEDSVGSLARSVYDQGSLSTHVATTRREVLTFKGYADAVLADLLEIHK